MSAADGERRPRQVALVVACLLALLVAAVATPGVVGVGDGGGAGDGTGDASGGGGTEGEASTDEEDDGVGVDDLLRWLLGDDGTERPVPPEYDVTVTPDPVPGRTVTVTVRRDGVPVEGARVAFNGRPVGRTNETGQVRGTVPYSDDLTVSVTPPNGGENTRSRAATHVAAAAVDGPIAATTPTGAGSGNENVTERYRLPTRATVTTRGTPDPGTTVTVVARVAGVPVRNATVAANGERVGRTDDRGRYALRIPDDGTERLDVRVSRGPVTGETTVVVRLLRARVTPDGPLAVPTRPATVSARIGRDPATNATVLVAGRRVATTDDEGRAKIALPADPTAAVVVSSGDRTARRSVLPLYAVTAVAVGLPTLALAGVAAVVVRRRRQVARGARRGAVGLVAAGRALARAAVVTAGVLVRGGRALARGLVRLGRAIARLLVRVPGAAVGALRSVPRPRAVAAWLLALPRRLARVPRLAVGWLFGTRGGERGTRARGDDGRGATTRGLRACWRAFARRVLPDRWRRRTPGEVARAAVDRGLPREPVLTVTEAFRELEYGSGTLPDDERERARTAFAALRGRTQAGDDERREERRGDGGDAE